MTVKQAYDDAINSYGELVKKLEAYATASAYDGKSDFKKWLGELDKATKEVEAAYGYAKAKMTTLETTLNDYVNANKQKIKDDKAKQDAVKTVDDTIRSIKEGLQEIRKHLDQNKA